MQDVQLGVGTPLRKGCGLLNNHEAKISVVDSGEDDFAARSF
jgi:hypothetical protein